MMAVVKRSIDANNFKEELVEILDKLNYKARTDIHYTRSIDIPDWKSKALYISEDSIMIRGTHKAKVYEEKCLYIHENDGKKYLPLIDVFLYQGHVSGYLLIQSKYTSRTIDKESLNYIFPHDFNHKFVDVLYFTDTNKDEAMLEGLLGG